MTKMRRTLEERRKGIMDRREDNREKERTEAGYSMFHAE